MIGVRAVSFYCLSLFLVCIFVFPVVSAETVTNNTDTINETFSEIQVSGIPTPFPEILGDTPEIIASQISPPEKMVSESPTSIISEEESACSSSADHSCSSSLARYPLMAPNKVRLDEEKDLSERSDKYSAPLKSRSMTIDTAPGATSRNLLPYLSYVPYQRNQGYCGNCWVWASTALLEVEHTVKTGVNDRLSIQYFNSKFNGGAGDNWACCGGNIMTFTGWYSTDKKPIPWSNTNAFYGDYSRTCGYSAGNNFTAVPISSITLTPQYSVDSITWSPVSTTGVGQNTAIANIKSAIDNNKAIYYSFNYGVVGWNAFFDYWDYQSEMATFNPTNYGGEETAGGHGVVIVGYDTTDPANPYWIVLNSWGTTAGRPNGLFRLKMDMNYDSTFTYTYDSETFTYPQHMFYILDAQFETEKIGVFRNGKWYVDWNGNYAWDSIDAQHIGNFGQAGDVPVSGDWNGDVKTEFGVFRSGYWYVDWNRNYVLDETDNLHIGYFGQAGDAPVSGDWTGEGESEFGVFRKGYWYVDWNGNYAWDATDAQHVGYFGQKGDIPVSGDWNGDSKSEIGVFRNGYWYVDWNGNYVWDSIDAQHVGYFGHSGDKSLSGIWTGNGVKKIGIHRNGYWYVDWNGNYAWDSIDAQHVGYFGADPGDIPVAGIWN